MNKKIVTIIIAIIMILLIVLGILYTIDMNNIKNNKPVIFSTWGKEYAPTIEKTSSNTTNVELENLPKEYSLEQAIKDECFIITNSKIYNKNKLDEFIQNTGVNSQNRKEDKIRIVEYTREGDPIITELSFKIKDETYILSGKPVNKTTYILKRDNTRDRFAEEQKITVDEDIPGEIYTISLQETCEETKLSLELTALIQYVDENAKVYNSIDVCSYLPNVEVANSLYFYGKVIESKQNYIIVEPNEGEEMRKSADKISIGLGEYNDAIYEVGTNVKITYTGYVMESYPAQVDAIKIELKSAENFEIRFYDKQPQTDTKIHKILDKSETDKYDYSIYSYDGSVNILINGKEMSLRNALLENKITMNEIIEKANQDLRNEKITGDIYKDGGSQIYNYENYTIIKYHTIEGNRDVYIGTKGMNFF